MKRILLGLVTIVGAVSALYIGTTGAFFSDTETSTGNTFTAGAIDLLVDNESYYNGNVCTNLGSEETPDWQWQGNALYPVPGTPCTTSWTLDDLTGHLFFNFTDLKPDDEGEDTISLHVNTNDAYMCMNIALTENDDNSSTGPELGDGDVQEDPQNEWDGELAQNIQMVWWADDGDNVLEEEENVISNNAQTLFNLASTSGPFVVALADSANNVWTDIPGPVNGNTTYYIGKAWCFGTLTLNAVAGNGGVDPSIDPGVLCDGTLLNNLTQTDSTLLDVLFEAVQARNNPNFLCETPPVTRSCIEEEVYANASHNVDQGTRKNGTGILADRTDPADALGAPQSLGTPYDNPVIAGSFFSLGFKGTPAAVPGGSIVVSFPGSVVNGSGADLKLWEVTGGTTYPDELVRVEVSDSLVGPWIEVAASVTRDAEVDIAPVASAKYVRITDVSPPGPFESEADGYDLDAVQALNCEIPLAP